MLNTNAIEIQDLLTKSFSSPDQRKKILSLALGITLAKLMPLPTDAQEDSNTFYNQNVIGLLNDKIYQFNEQIVLNTEYTLQIARAHWFIRYNTLYQNTEHEIIVNDDYDFYSKVFGVDTYVSLDDYKLSNLNKFVLFSLINKLTRYFKE